MPKGFETRQLILVLLVFAVLWVALGISYLSVSLDAPRITIVPFFHEDELTSILTNVLFFLSIASLSIPFFYISLKRGWISHFEKMFAVAGGFLTLFSIGMLSMHIFELFPSFLLFILVWLCLFFIGFSMILTVTNIFSSETRNAVLIMYSSVAGSFLGMGIPTFSMILVMVSLCVIDIVAIRSGLIKDVVNSLKEERIFISLRYSGKELMIGFGDLIYYSMLDSFTIINFGVLTAIFSTLLILVGVLVTFFFTTKSEIFPGLPIPIGLGLIPITLELLRRFIL